MIESAERKPAAQPLAQFEGVLSSRLPGWQFHAADSNGKLESVPFEGRHEDKGGRLQSPPIVLNKPAGECSYYELRFSAQTGGHCYWWVDFMDREGLLLPDCNSAIYPGPARDYVQLVVAPPDATEVRLAFQSASGVEARDLSMRRIDAAAAARWCDRVYAELPPLDFTPPADALQRLPGTVAALHGGKPFAVVMLGDSIVNDMYTSGFQALLQRDYPASRFRFVASVRGSTGCRFYRDPAHFEEYVGKHRPELLLIGGISNGDSTDAMAAIGEVIAMARAGGTEVVLASPPKSREWRTSEAPQRMAPDENIGGTMPLREMAIQRKLARELNVAFFDLTTPCVAYFGRSRMPLGHFNRDAVHNNDRGKQIVGRILHRYFLAGAQNAKAKSGGPGTQEEERR